eukprot:8723687-Pyramimonas_sp.AAC.1
MYTTAPASFARDCVRQYASFARDANTPSGSRTNTTQEEWAKLRSKPIVHATCGMLGVFPHVPPGPERHMQHRYMLYAVRALLATSA